MKFFVPERTPRTKDEDVYLIFASIINLKQEDGISYLSIELHDADMASQLVNDLIEYVDKETVECWWMNYDFQSQNKSGILNTESHQNGKWQNSDERTRLHNIRKLHL